MENQKENINENKNKSGSFLDRLNMTPSEIKYVLIAFLIIGVMLGCFYWYMISQRVYSDKAEIFTPLINLSVSQPSILQRILVKDGDKVSANQTVAILDNANFVVAKQDGVVVNISDQVGKLFTPGEPIVTMIDAGNLRLIVHIPENKGISSINVGQKVIFAVDAYDSKEFAGTVEEISQTSDQSSVVFSISDKRDEKNFSIKVKYNDYPELLNGMSAKAWIYK